MSNGKSCRTIPCLLYRHGVLWGVGNVALHLALIKHVQPFSRLIEWMSLVPSDPGSHSITATFKVNPITGLICSRANHPMPDPNPNSSPRWTPLWGFFRTWSVFINFNSTPLFSLHSRHFHHFEWNESEKKKNKSETQKYSHCHHLAPLPPPSPWNSTNEWRTPNNGFMFFVCGVVISIGRVGDWIN